ncbi:M13 family metallopeptidase neprilysin 2 isoform X2 [Arctopsyche grandis]|uniref:M13 family metallopeptidase neprilysin 2 isoform X2 n=1 Tax=Arctopsyche grandis TaxID=121162 RepID=UPI00406D9E6C
MVWFDFDVNYVQLGNPGWWKRRTGTEKLLTLISVASSLVVVALAVALAVVVINQKSANNGSSVAEALNGGPQNSIVVVPNSDTKTPDICLSPGCIHTASGILKNIDDSVDPCDDFYEFSCGKFLKKTRIPDDQSSVNTFSIIGDELQEQLRTILDEKPQPNEPKPFTLARNLFLACMNTTSIESRGVEPLHKILKKLGGWPLLEGPEWKESEFTWMDIVYKMRKIGYSIDYFIDTSVGVDVKNSTKRVIDVDDASLGLSREYLTKGFSDKLVTAYYDYMVDIAVLLGANKERAQVELKESILFEIALANISLPLEKRRNATALYNPMTIKEMQQKFPSIPWKIYFNTLLAPYVNIDDEEVVVVNVPKFITGLEEILAKTSKRTQANYVLWRVVGASVSYLTETLRRRQLAFGTVLSGKTERESRWKECVDTAGNSLALAVGALYVKKYFDENAKKNALEMVNDIRSEFLNILEDVDWMDDKTKKSAVDKAGSMATHIAYPQELLENEKLTEFYSELEISPDTYLESVLNLTLFGTGYSFKQLRKPVNKTDWIRHGRPAIVNAFYSSIENSIQFPAGILQGVFFSSQRPRYMNYGAIGFVIGHEITHGFDDQGRQFDKDGNLVDWWEAQTKHRYLEKAQCIIDQYSNYSVKDVGLNLNGINTQGENIADNGGIKVAYLAYLKWAKRNGGEQKLPGLNYTPQQLFWISAANTWCSVYRPEALKLRITTGFHSPGRFRVVGPISNMEEYAKDFNCPLGSKMNPKHKCRVW